MKKAGKIVLASVLGAAFVASLTLNVLLIARQSNMGGSIFGGDVNEEWNMTEVNISLDQDTEYYCYSSNPGDYIFSIWFHEINDSNYAIHYEANFNIFDDLEVYFVFNNSGFVTDTETTHWTFAGDYVEISAEDASAHNLKDDFIREAWVRTID